MALKYSIDGNQVCAVDVHFQCLATCHAGFGDSLKDAFLDFYKTSKRKPSLKDCYSWEIEWVRQINN